MIQKELKESHIREQIIDYIFKRGGWATRIATGEAVKTFERLDKKTNEMKTVTYRYRLADVGTPDVIACLNGHFLAIEVKKNDMRVAEWYRQKSNTSKAQKRTLLEIEKKGGHIYVVCSVLDLEKLLYDEGILSLKKSTHE